MNPSFRDFFKTTGLALTALVFLGSVEFLASSGGGDGKTFIRGINLSQIPAARPQSDTHLNSCSQEPREGHSNIRKYFEHLFELDGLSVRIESGQVRQYGNIFIQSGKYVFACDRKDGRVI